VILTGQQSTHAEGCALARRGLALKQASLDPSSPDVITGLTNVARCHQEAGEVAEARRVFQEAASRKLGQSDRAALFGSYGPFLAEQGELEPALRMLRTSAADAAVVHGADSDETLWSRVRVTDALRDGGRAAEALRELDDILALCRRAGITRAIVPDVHARRGYALAAQGKLEPALRELREAERAHQRLRTPDADHDYTLHALGEVELRLGHAEAARPYLERALAVRPAGMVGKADVRAGTAFALARALAARDHDRACGLAREAAKYHRTSGRVIDRPRARDTDHWLAQQACARE
jgi:tetratricopeptide (TPR) repeat protein